MTSGGGPEAPEQAQKSLRRAAAERPITFVLGAGVSIPRGVPDWRRLTRGLWQRFAPRRAVPAWLEDRGEALDRIRAWAKANEAAGLDRQLCFGAPHPLADQMAIELLRRDAGDDAAFLRELRAAFYRDARVPAGRGDTLGVLARTLVADQASDRRRVLRVITFNADDHLEREGNGGHDPRRDPVLWPIARESGHPRASRGAGGRPPIPVYHVHGFLPRDGEARAWRDAPDTLVFTDAEYWATVASPLSFANRVMAQALHDSSCVFVGVSMNDVNVIRWLGVRYNAVTDDVAAQHGADGAGAARRTREALLRHFWIRPADGDPHGLVSELLLARGVRSVPIAGWGAPFEALLRGCFAPLPLPPPLSRAPAGARRARPR